MALTAIADDYKLAAFGTTLATSSGELVFTAPCRPVRSETDEVAASAADQVTDACRNAFYALERSGASPADIIRVRLWISSQGIADAVKAAVIELFPDAQSRPAFSLVVTDHEAGIHVFAEVLAVRAGVRRSIYSSDDKERTLPAGCIKGNILCTGNLSTSRVAAGSGAPVVTFADQVEMAFQHLDDVLAQAKLCHNNVAHMMVWYRDHSFRDAVNEPFVKRFPTLGDRPARHSLVRELPEGVGVQIEALAVCDERRFTYTVPGCYHHGIQHLPNSLPFATRVGNILHSAATYGHVVDDGSRGGTLEEQCDIAFKHSESVLDSAGMTLKDVSHIYVWLADKSSSETVSRVWTRYFGPEGAGPVRHDVVSPLPTIDTGPFLVQLELTAIRRS